MSKTTAKKPLPTAPKGQPQPQALSYESPYPNLEGVRRLIAVSSGKGGVGKSTVSVSLARYLAAQGLRVGLMDSDVYGPSIPKLLGEFEQPAQEEGMIVPPHAKGISYMSLALMAGEGSPVIWRGPMASRMVQTFLGQVKWGELDVLLIDLPPGTGDVQLTLAQSAPLDGAIIVTTPQSVATDVASRGIRMFQQVSIPLLGVVENMSGYTCSHCGDVSYVFEADGGKALAEAEGIPFLGALPLDPIWMQSFSENAFADGAAHKAMEQISKKVASLLEDDTHVQNDHVDGLNALNASIVFHWASGVETQAKTWDLRFQCQCAHCVDENTGVRRLKPEDVNQDVFVQSVRPVGRYGLQFQFSDGHGSGIYTFKHLKSF